MRKNSFLLCCLIVFSSKGSLGEEKAEYLYQCTGQDIRLPCAKNTADIAEKPDAIWWNILTKPLNVLVLYLTAAEKIQLRADPEKYYFNKTDYSLTIRGVHPSDGIYLYVCRTSAGHSHRVNITIAQCDPVVAAAQPPIYEWTFGEEDRCRKACTGLFIIASLSGALMFLLAPVAHSFRFKGNRNTIFLRWYIGYLTCAFMAIVLGIVVAALYFNTSFGKTALAWPMGVAILHSFILGPIIWKCPNVIPAKRRNAPGSYPAPRRHAEAESDGVEKIPEETKDEEQ